jgi:hypothetical protein
MGVGEFQNHITRMITYADRETIGENNVLGKRVTRRSKKG